jgi:hypothetical protein
MIRQELEPDKIQGELRTALSLVTGQYVCSPP